MLVTLVIIPIEEVDDCKLLESFDSIPARYIRLQKNRYFNVEVTTEWKMFMYGNEYLSPQLVKALPVILRDKEFDYFSFYNLRVEGSEFKYGISPRLFRSGVKLRNNAVFPIDIDCLKGITILDGFILQCLL